MSVGQCWFLEKASWLKVFVTSARSLADMFSCLFGCVSYLFGAGNLGHIIVNIQANALVFGSNNSLEISLFKTYGLQPFEQLLLLGNDQKHQINSKIESFSDGLLYSRWPGLPSGFSLLHLCRLLVRNLTYKAKLFLLSILTTITYR